MLLDSPLFKHIDLSFAQEFFRSGKIRIGTLYDFRKVEKYGPEIGDVDEGTKTLATAGYHMIDTGDPSTIPAWYGEHFEKTFRLEANARLVIHARDGVRTRLTVPDRYVFCMSEEDDENLRYRLGYNACLKINSPRSFFHALSKKLKHRAKWKVLDRCVYRARLVVGEKDIDIEPALIKEEVHSYQREVRAIWEAVDRVIAPFILKVKEARQYCELRA